MKLPEDLLATLPLGFEERQMAWRGWAVSQQPALLEEGQAPRLALIEDFLECLRPRLLRELARQFSALREKDTDRMREAHQAVSRVNAHFDELVSEI